jgi:hypothetical protein
MGLRDTELKNWLNMSVFTGLREDEFSDDAKSKGKSVIIIIQKPLIKSILVNVHTLPAQNATIDLTAAYTKSVFAVNVHC